MRWPSSTSMTGTDERRSRSRSGTPFQGDFFVPQPVFLSQPGNHSRSGTPQVLPVVPPPIPLVDAPQMQGVEYPAVGDDPFRIYDPDDPGIINLNEDMPEMRNAPQWMANIQGPDRAPVHSHKREEIFSGSFHLLHFSHPFLAPVNHWPQCLLSHLPKLWQV